jgi:hypothetical protein
MVRNGKLIDMNEIVMELGKVCLLEVEDAELRSNCYGDVVAVWVDGD